MATITISVPDEMKTLLEKHTRAFNVSGACQKAIQEELDRLASVSEHEVMLADVDRQIVVTRHRLCNLEAAADFHRRKIEPLHLEPEVESA